jgi:hypothetical protein
MVEPQFGCSEFQCHLSEGERLIWCDRSLDSEVRRGFGRAARVLGVMSAAICIAVLVEFLRGKSDPQSLGRTLPLMIVMGVFFFILALTAFRAASRPYRFWYGLTDRRVLLLGANGVLASYEGHAFFRTEIKMIRSGSENRGILRFDYGPDGEGVMRFRAEFLGIGDPEGVERLIRQHLLPDTTA